MGTRDSLVTRKSPRAAAVRNVVERLEYYGALSDASRSIRREEFAQLIVDAVLAIAGAK